MYVYEKEDDVDFKPGFLLSLFKIVFLLFISVNMCGMCMWVQCPSEENTWFPWSWSYSYSWVACYACWEWNSASLQEMQILFLNCWVISPILHLQWYSMFIQMSMFVFMRLVIWAKAQKQLYHWLYFCIYTMILLSSGLIKVKGISYFYCNSNANFTYILYVNSIVTCYILHIF